MPIFIAALLGGLVQAAGSLVGKVLLSLGVGYVAYTGVDASLAWARDFAIAKLQAAPTRVFVVLAALKIGTCVSILFSALLARLTLNGLTNGALKRMVQK